ncbi:MAG: hypothetical protein IKB23_00835 [Clostridia bacterium]|nr:hypothetical protein [Clostridia bacterium]
MFIKSDILPARFASCAAALRAIHRFCDALAEQAAAFALMSKLLDANAFDYIPCLPRFNSVTFQQFFKV